MVGVKSKRFEILLLMVVILNFTVMVLVFKTYRSDSSSELESKLKFLQKFENFQLRIGVEESAKVRINNDDLKAVTNDGEKPNDIKPDNFAGVLNKLSQTVKQRNSSKTSMSYCAKYGENLGKYISENHSLVRQ